MDLAKEIFLLTSQFPKSELYGLVSQMRRAAVAIPSNIAEGHGRKSYNEYRHYFSIAYGSVLELETQLLLSKQLNMTAIELFSQGEKLHTEVAKMLNVMTSKKLASRS